jgi:ATP-dependent DNA ligase
VLFVQEGVVIKGMSTTYKFGSRAEKNGWFKIKPDYGIQSMLDLAVVAVRHENNSNKVKSFLVAAREGRYRCIWVPQTAQLECYAFKASTNRCVFV